MTALTANQSEVPANWASTKTGNTWKGTLRMSVTLTRAAMGLAHKVRELPENAIFQIPVFFKHRFASS
jgi:hypothetical protein